MLHAVLEIFLWLFGLCVGSFLNVVIYRLPAGLSIAVPARSFCPRCTAGIAWYDNLPILSWALLWGRCRHCRAPISVQYPLVEALTGVAFVLVYHLLFVVGARSGVAPATLPHDLPLLLTWLVLVSGLLACAAMDVTSYMVDVRVTLAVLVGGVILHACWPRADFVLPQAQAPAAAAAGLAFAASIVMLWLTVWRCPPTDAEEHPPADVSSAEEPPPAAGATRAAGLLGVLACILLTAGLFFAGVVPWLAGHPTFDLLAGLTLVTLFLTTVVAGGQRRPADEEIRAAIEEEQPQARRTALAEIAWLAPALLTALGAYAAVALWPTVGAGWRSAVAWTPGGGFVPLGGVAFAIHGAIVAAGAGWLLRIVFTLAFGREAFGIGDIYILGAAGAAAGWDIALLGLALSVGIALLGWAFGLLLKSTTLIPFGPWLALGFLLALLWNRPAASIAAEYRDNLAFAWRERPDLVLLGIGLMLVATAFAIVLARLVRRWVDPHVEGGTAGEA